MIKSESWRFLSSLSIGVGFGERRNARYAHLHVFNPRRALRVLSIDGAVFRQRNSSISAQLSNAAKLLNRNASPRRSIMFRRSPIDLVRLASCLSSSRSPCVRIIPCYIFLLCSWFLLAAAALATCECANNNYHIHMVRSLFCDGCCLACDSDTEMIGGYRRGTMKCSSASDSATWKLAMWPTDFVHGVFGEIFREFGVYQEKLRIRRKYRRFR